MQFLIIGDGPYKNALINEISQNTNKNIKYIWKISNWEIYKYFLISDVFLMPSEEEWFPRVLLESMSCNIPYVASDIWWVREISTAHQQKFIYDVGDVDSFAKWLNLILREKFDFTQFISKFDREKVRKRFIKLIK
jgi:glycosyltransferase involved in cell wall biosynthesis